MIKEKTEIDFYTTGRQPSEHEFAQISEWIKKDKEKRKGSKKKKQQEKVSVMNP